MPALHWLTREEDIGAASRAPYRLMEKVGRLERARGIEPPS